MNQAHQGRARGINNCWGEKRIHGGGGTSCVPNCSSNSNRTPKLSFYKFPKNAQLKKAWLHWIGRAHFKPNEHHRVCSTHFEGGKKTYLGNVPLYPSSLSHQHKIGQPISIEKGN